MLFRSNRQLMSGVAQLSWGDGGVGSRLCLSQLGLAHNGESELSEYVMYFLGANARMRETLAQGVIGSKGNTPKKRRMYRVHAPARRLAFQRSSPPLGLFSRRLRKKLLISILHVLHTVKLLCYIRSTCIENAIGAHYYIIKRCLRKYT